jgi:acyl-CoA hydrolase
MSMTTASEFGGSNREITFRFLAEPGDVNFGGKVHGGAVMKWIDQAGYACAVSWSGYYCVTAYVGGIRFYKPIFIGQLVEITATLVHTGSSSMHIAVHVCATDPKTGKRETTTQCLIVMVAVGPEGGKVTIRPWIAVTEEDRRRQAYAMRIAAMAKEQEKEFSAEKSLISKECT